MHERQALRRAAGAKGTDKKLPSLIDESALNPHDETRRYQSVAPRPVAEGSTLPELMAVYVDVLSGPNGSSSHQLTKTRTTIGRGAEVDIRIDDSKLSRHHLSILYVGNEFRIRDEQSANGTLLNGSLVLEYAIRDHDKILVGDSLLRFRYG